MHIILSVVIYGCETWSLTLRLRLFENRIPRRIFGPIKDENEDCRELHDEEPHNLYRLLNIINVFKSRRLKLARHVPAWKKVGVLLKL